jgi:DNA polymerase elongation subunit (family B)
LIFQCFQDPATYAYTDASGLLLNLPSVNAARVFPPRANPTVAEFAAHRVPSPRLGLPTDVAVAAFDSELWCLAAFVHLIRTLDPDIVVGFEVQKSSFGYLIDRYAALTRSTTRPPEFIPRGLPPRPPAAPAPAQNFSSAYAGGLGSAGLSNAQSNRPPSSTPVEVNYFTAKLSRELPARVDEYYDNVTRGFGKRGGADIWSDTHGAGLVVAGRIVLNLWRILRTEVKINVYTFESCVFSILHERIPHFSPQALSAMFGVATDRDPVAMHTALSYLLRRSQLNQALLHQLDLISRTSELARVFGQDFVAVLTRGSQYRVESMLIRLCKSQNYRLLSATTAQVSSQAAIECIPLVMEPISRFYTSPVLVLDFRSLYPSMMMAHNICFSTCLGKIPTAAAVNNASADGIRSRCGVTNINLPSGFLADHADDIWIAPNGCMFAKDSLRKGVLPRMMYEILRTRESVKQKMKECKQSSNDPALIRLLNARQFGLKLIANVTYGYTAASFSGRMPCVDIADAIVQSARETLETAIRLVEETEKWRATGKFLIFLLIFQSHFVDNYIFCVLQWCTETRTVCLCCYQVVRSTMRSLSATILLKPSHAHFQLQSNCNSKRSFFHACWYPRSVMWDIPTKLHRKQHQISTPRVLRPSDVINVH